MKAVLCAAGIGKRMNHLTIETPKPLLPVGEKTIIEYIVDNLSTAGIKEVVVVVGYKAEMIKSRLGSHYGDCSITYVDNTDFVATNNIYSLWLARDLITEGMIFLNCDIVFNDEILPTLIADEQPDSIVTDFEINLVDDSLRAFFENGRLADIGKTIEKANGWAMGIYKLSQNASEEYFKIAGGLFAQEENNRNISFVVPLRIMASKLVVAAVPITSGEWAEIDTPEDFQRAVEIFGN